MTRYITPLLLAAALFTSPTLAERIPLEPGPDTTVYEGPLRDDGTVDYIAAMNALLSEGVTPENNAFVSLFAMRPADYHYLEDRYREMLGLPEEEGRHAFVRFNDFMAEPGRGGTVEEAHELGGQAQANAFDGDDLPDVMAWLERNEPVLDAVVAGLARPRFYAPWVNDDEDGLVVLVLLPHLGLHRTYGRALSRRINMAVGEGRLDEAVNDLLSLRRLGAHARTEPTLISNLVGHSIESMSVGSLQIVLSHGGLTAEELGRIEADWSPQVGKLSMAQSIDLGERLLMLDMLQQAWAGRLGDDPDEVLSWAFDGQTPTVEMRAAFALMDDERFDINLALRHCNSVYDKIGKLFEEVDYARFVEASAAFEAELQEGLTPEKRRVLRAAAHGRMPVDAMFDEVTEVAVQHLVTLLLPGFNGACRTEMYAQAQANLARLGLALERFKLDDGTYPDTLNELVPDYLDALPVDVFNGGQPVRYLPDNDRLGYAVYSVGRDQEDDGGLDERSGGDIVFRVAPE